MCCGGPRAASSACDGTHPGFTHVRRWWPVRFITTLAPSLGGGDGGANAHHPEPMLARSFFLLCVFSASGASPLLMPREDTRSITFGNQILTILPHICKPDMK